MQFQEYWTHLVPPCCCAVKESLSLLLDMVNFQLMKISIAEHSSDVYIVEPICQNTMPKVTEIPNVFRKRATFSSGFFQKEQCCFHRHAMHCALKFGQYPGGKYRSFWSALCLINSSTRAMFSLQIYYNSVAYYVLIYLNLMWMAISFNWQECACIFLTYTMLIFGKLRNSPLQLHIPWHVNWCLVPMPLGSNPPWCWALLEWPNIKRK